MDDTDTYDVGDVLGEDVDDDAHALEQGDTDAQPLSPEAMETLIEGVVIDAARRELIEDEVSIDREEAFSTLRQAQKPDISDLDDAIVEVDGVGVVFLPQVGDGLLIEYPVYWRDTTYFVVMKIDDNTGIVSLWNPQKMNWSLTNFKDAAACELVMKMPPAGAIGTKLVDMLTKRTRGRPRKNILEAATRQAEVGPDGKPVKRGRGRPKGSKNRPKEVILAEREQIEQERVKRIEIRSMRRRLRFASR